MPEFFIRHISVPQKSKSVFMKSLLLAVSLLLLFLPGCTPSAGQEQRSGFTSYKKALQVIQASKRAHIGSVGSNGIYLKGKGTYDLSVRMQGLQPDTVEPYPIEEQLAVDLQSGKVVYESDTRVNPDAREHIRYTYDGQNRMLFLDLFGGFAFWDAAPGMNLQSRRYSNMLPRLLLEEALEHRHTLNYLGSDSEGNELVSFVSPSYGTLTLYIDSDSRYLAGVEYLKDMPLLGDTPVLWHFKEYRFVEGVGPYPSGYTVTLNGRLLKDIDYGTIQAEAHEAPIMSVADSIQVPEMPEPPASGSGEPDYAAEESPVRDPIELADGVYVLPHIRPGFHPMVVEFEEFLMVIDTPAGWLEMQQLPAMQWVDGATSSSTGRKLLSAIREKISGKPVRYAALTHHHSDHAGGIRPFIAAGATVLASEATATVVRNAAKNRFTLEPDELTGKEILPDIEIVNGERTISDGSMEVRLIDVGENPHAGGMLVAYLPEHKILYQSDLFEPIPMRVFPSMSRAPVMKWFVSWLDNSGLDVERVYAIHAGLRVTEEHLNHIRNMK